MFLGGGIVRRIVRRRERQFQERERESEYHGNGPDETLQELWMRMLQLHTS